MSKEKKDYYSDFKYKKQGSINDENFLMLGENLGSIKKAIDDQTIITEVSIDLEDTNDVLENLNKSLNNINSAISANDCRDNLNEINATLETLTENINIALTAINQSILLQEVNLEALREEFEAAQTPDYTQLTPSENIVSYEYAYYYTFGKICIVNIEGTNGEKELYSSGSSTSGHAILFSGAPIPKRWTQQGILRTTDFSDSSYQTAIIRVDQEGNVIMGFSGTLRPNLTFRGFITYIIDY